MLYDGKSVQCYLDDNKIVHVVFNMKEGSANVLGTLMTGEIAQAIGKIEACTDKKALLFRSEKDHFIFGADITEFVENFKLSEPEVKEWILGMNHVLNRFEDLEVPTIALINGFALGGGFEVCLAADYRIALSSARIGLPETKLGIMPGWGGTVRLPRIAGADHAIEWITSGKQWKAEDGAKIKVIDGVIDAKLGNEGLLDRGIRFLNSCIEGKVDWQSRKVEKKSPLRLSQTEAAMVFQTSKAFVAGMAGPHYPAPVKAIETMEKAYAMDRAGAVDIETSAFAFLTQTPQAKSLVQVFLADQYLKKVSKKTTKGTDKVKKAAVLGAGIMGGGVAYQSASTGTPIIMKDINDDAIELGLSEASKLLGKQLKRGKIDATKMAATLNTITPTLSYGDFNSVDLVVEAVVENPKIKDSVLCELEDKVEANTILTSNTSTISINTLAKNLKRPENFCGMHFFNPVHRMPLVEVIRGEKTSDEAIAKTVQYALQMKKTPIVVNDCPGFLVNRVLFPYFNAFGKLIEDGVDYKRIDKVMEKFGWPMGPAYLMDVVGIDTGDHAAKIMADAFPDRMKMDNKTIIEVLHENKRLGQKNGVGFYKYELDRKGKPKKLVDESVDALIKTVVKNTVEITDEEIVTRMMLPMIFECARCLEEKIVNTPTEVDMGLLLGLGFPPFRAGALAYADELGLKTLVEQGRKYESIGAMYAPTDFVVKLAEANQNFYGRN